MVEGRQTRRQKQKMPDLLTGAAMMMIDRVCCPVSLLFWAVPHAMGSRVQMTFAKVLGF